MTDLLIGIAGNGFPCPGTSGIAVTNGDVVYRTKKNSSNGTIGSNNGGNCTASIYRNSEMRHSRSEDLLGPGTRSPSPLLATASEDDLIAASALRDCNSPACTPCTLPPRAAGSSHPLADRIDPEDSIRDIVTENDLYRFVLFKRHYDKYVALAARYEEARGLAYYLEERYHEVKMTKINLRSSDGEIYKVNVNIAKCSVVIKDMLEALGENKDEEEAVLLPNVNSVILNKVINWMTHYKDNPAPTEDDEKKEKHTTDISPWDTNFLQAEREKLEETRLSLEKRLEGCEIELRDKEEELFLQLERSLRLEDEAERTRADRDACVAARDRLEREQTSALRQLQFQATQNEITRRSLERARQDVVRQATVIRAERDALERENVVLKEKLRIGEGELGAERRRREEGVAALTHETAILRHAARHLRAAAIHATSCRRRRRCSVCLYAKRTFAEVDDYRDDGKLFKCLQAPLQDLRTWLRPNTPTSYPALRTSSPLDRGISFIDDSSSSSEDEEFPSTPVAEVSLSSANSAPATARAFSSDSGFSSEVGDRRSRSYEAGGSSRKISESSSSGPEGQRTVGAFTRSRWTSSFRKLLSRKSKAKNITAADRSSS